MIKRGQFNSVTFKKSQNFLEFLFPTVITDCDVNNVEDI